MKENHKPKFYRPRPLPFKIKDLVTAELKRKIDEGIYLVVETSEYGTPIVPVIKNGKVRICGAYNATINDDIVVDRYPLPKVDDLFLELSNSIMFSKIDLAHAYEQMSLDDKSSKILTLSTHIGLLMPLRLQYGVNSASGIFQREIEKIIQGICLQLFYFISYKQSCLQLFYFIISSNQAHKCFIF